MSRASPNDSLRSFFAAWSTYGVAPRMIITGTLSPRRSVFAPKQARNFDPRHCSNAHLSATREPSPRQISLSAPPKPARSTATRRNQKSRAGSAGFNLKHRSRPTLIPNHRVQGLYHNPSHRAHREVPRPLSGPILPPNTTQTCSPCKLAPCSRVPRFRRLAFVDPPPAASGHRGSTRLPGSYLPVNTPPPPPRLVRSSPTHNRQSLSLQGYLTDSPWPQARTWPTCAAVPYRNLYRAGLTPPHAFAASLVLAAPKNQRTRDHQVRQRIQERIRRAEKMNHEQPDVRSNDQALIITPPTPVTLPPASARAA